MTRFASGGRQRRPVRPRTVGVLPLLVLLGCSGPTLLQEEHPDPPCTRFLRPALPRLDPALEKPGPGPGGFREAFVELREQVDLGCLVGSPAYRAATTAERGDLVRAALRAAADRRDTALGGYLDELLADGALDHVQGVALANRLVISATPEALRALASRPEIARVFPPPRGRDLFADSSGVSERESPREDAWAVAAMGIDRLHARGLDGSGVRIGILDSGVSPGHAAFGNARGEEPSWFDPHQHRREPWDSRGHGTQVLACALGRPVDGWRRSAAPGATWVAALANPNNAYDGTARMLAADWMLFEGRPRIVLNAWGHAPGQCVEDDRDIIDAFRAAEILPVFPAGNGGPDPGTGESPATLTGFLPDGGPALSVGALGPDLRAIDPSARGPRPCGDEPFPLLAAPGSDLPVPFLGSRDRFAPAWGTSLAVGWVGGAAALLFQARPDLGIRDIEQALIASARDLPPAGPDDATGHGLVRVDAALLWLERHRPAPAGGR